MSDDGDLIGFDVDFIHWITKYMEANFSDIVGENLTVEIHDLPWSKLLPNLRNYQIDLIISSMTSTEQREIRFPGIKFTKGYFQCHQLLIHKIENRYTKDNIYKKKVGVAKNTTNEEAALYLKDEFNFEVVNTFDSYADIYRDLDSGDIDLGLVDDVLAEDLIGTRFGRVDLDLTSALRDFYQKEFKRDGEYYAIAVVDESHIHNNRSLIHLLNQVLDSEDGREELIRLEDSWIKLK